MPPLAVADARALTRIANAKRNSAYPKRAVSRRRTCSRTEFNPLFGEDRTKQRIERAVGPTFLRSGARGLKVRAKLPPEPTKHEARKRRASERPRVACCEELGCSRDRLRFERKAPT